MKENDVTKSCNVCGAEIAKNAKACPQCGGKNKKPIYKRGWFIAIIIIIAIIVLSSVMGGEDEPTPKQSQGSKSIVRHMWKLPESYPLLIVAETI